MTVLIRIAIVMLFIIAFAVLCIIFNSKMRFLFQFLLNGALGFAVLIVFNYLGSYIGIDLGVNLLSSATVGVLGFPGLGVLLILKLLLHT